MTHTLYHKVRSVTPYSDFIIVVQFCEGVTKVIDVKMLYDVYPKLACLKDDLEEFCKVSVDLYGYGIVWNEDTAALSGDDLWIEGVREKTPFDGLMSFADAAWRWGLNESTLRKAVFGGKLRDGIDACKFGKQWLVSTEAMKREYGDIDCEYEAIMKRRKRLEGRNPWTRRKNDAPVRRSRYDKGRR